VAWACGVKPTDTPIAVSSPTPNEQLAPTVQLIINSTLKLGAPLELRWRLSNPGTQPIYVYSSLLRETFGADVEINPEIKSIEVRFTRLEPLAIAPNYFPEVQFIKIDPGKTEEGTHTSHGPSKGLITYRSNGSRMAELRLSPGEWAIRILIAYGYEIESFKQGSRSNEHPINPVVRWQRIAYSNPERIVRSLVRGDRDAHIDHLVSLRAGGSNALGNFVLTCRICNGDEKRDENWQSFLRRKAPDDVTYDLRRKRIDAWIADCPGGAVLDPALLSVVDRQVDRAIAAFDVALENIRALKQRGG